MWKTYLRVSLLLLTFSFIGCSDQTTVYKDTFSDDIIVEENAALLEQSINYDAAGVIDFYEEDNSVSDPAGRNVTNEAGDHPFSQVARVEAPMDRDGVQLTASHVNISGDFAYVSYNLSGEGYSGGVDIIDIADPNVPRVTGRLYYANADLNGIVYDNGYVYVAGGVDASASTVATENSFVSRIPVVNGRFGDLSTISYGFQAGYNGNDIRVNGDQLIMTSGKNGVVGVYDKNTMAKLSEHPFQDLRSIAMDQGKMAVLDASKGISILDPDFQVTNEILITSDFGDAAKKTISMDGDRIIVSEGGKGSGIYSASSGSLESYIPIMANPDNVDTSDQVTNAVAVNEGVLFMANGGAGLSLTEMGSNEYETVGVALLEGSINYVASKGDYLFAASGKEGLQIVKLNRPGASLEGRCKSLPVYEGSAKFFVPKGEVAEYRGSKRFNNMDIEGSALLCGSWTVINDVLTDEDALFEMFGTLVIGRNKKKKDLIIEKNATVRIEGNLTVYGDVIIEEGATLEFLGDNNEVVVFGKVEQDKSATVSGNFRDVRKKF